MPNGMAQPQEDDLEQKLRLLGELADLAGMLGAGDVEKRLAGLRAEWRRPLRVALLGEQATKVRPINEFLGADALPALVTVGIDRVLVADDNDFLEMEQGSVRRRLDLTPSSWEVADSSPEVSAVSVHLRSARLKRADVELLDVPLTRRRDEPFAIPGSSIQGCPVAFLLVAAASQITRWEQDMLREAFVRNFFPFLAVGVVGLRWVAEEERGAVLAAIRRTVRVIDPSLEVIVDDEATEPNGEPIIGRLLESLFSKADVRFLRQAWLNRSLVILLDEIDIFLRERERADRLTDHDRSGELRQAEHDRDEIEEAWLDARLELRQRQASLVDQIQREIGNLQSSALPQLRAEMNTASDVKRWATDRMAAAIREFLVDSVHQVDRQIRNRVERDSDWLLSRFPSLAGELPQAVQPLVLHDDYIRMPYMDLQVFTAAGQDAGIRSATQQAIPAVSAALKVPVPALNLLSSIATMTLDRNQERKEKEEVGSLLSQTFRRAASRFAEDAEEYVMTVYERLESQVQRSVQALLDNKFTALKKQDRWSAKELPAIRGGIERIREALRAYPGALPERTNDNG